MIDVSVSVFSQFNLVVSIVSVFASPSFAVDENFDKLQKHDNEAMKAPPVDKALYEMVKEKFTVME